MNEVIPASYRSFLKQIKERIASSQFKAAAAVNRELIKLYWEIGSAIHKKQETEGWGTQVIERLAKDLQKAFPGIEGFSRSNVFRMKAFFLALKFIQAIPLKGIPWLILSNECVQSSRCVDLSLWQIEDFFLQRIWSAFERIAVLKVLVSSSWV